MRIQLRAATATRAINVAWISFDPKGYISFGLNDRSFISPKFRASHLLWNADNRVKIWHRVSSDQVALVSVQNPHFTFHPPNFFHLRSNEKGNKAPLFQGITEVAHVLEEQGEMPWLRATTGTLSAFKTKGIREQQNACKFDFPVLTEVASVEIEVDFVRPDTGYGLDHMSRRYFTWHGVGLRVSLAATYPQTPLLSWFHIC